jgi:hypothetical protein
LPFDFACNFPEAFASTIAESAKNRNGDRIARITVRNNLQLSLLKARVHPAPEDE